MVHLSLQLDEFGRLACQLTNKESTATVSCADVREGLLALSGALDDVEKDGAGECFWLRSAGEYRWVFRRLDEQVRLAVLWCGSVAIGFQHVFWAECPFDELVSRLRAAIEAFSVQLVTEVTPSAD
ncbi:MAG: hypothetical protein ABI693_12780 [Bryobacteraceae bacterium]